MGKVGQITTHLLEGSPEGIRLVEFGNWAGRGLVAARASWAALMGRMELDLGGIYFLKRPDSRMRSGQILVGTALALRPALEAIAADPVWTDMLEVTVFVRRWGWKEADELAYLANELRNMSLFKPALVMHGKVPPGVRLRPEKRVELESDLDHVLDLLKLSGFDWEAEAVEAVSEDERNEVEKPYSDSEAISAIPSTPEPKPIARPRGRPPKGAHKTTTKTPSQEPDLFRVEEPVQAEEHTQVEEPAEPAPVIGKYHLEKRGIKATMDIIDGRFVVREGSQAKKVANPSMEERYRKIRARLVEEGVLVEAGEDHYVFTRDYAFDSASTSASVVNGAQTAGPRAWYDENNVSLRGIPNDHHSLHETHRKPKDEATEEADDADITASFKFDEQDDVLDEAIDYPFPSPRVERIGVPVLLGNERLAGPESHEPKREDTPKQTAESHSASDTPVGKYRIIGKQVEATMDVVPGGYLVRRGSRALNKVSTTIAKHYLDLRAEMVRTGVLVEQSDTYYEFTKDYLFSSISAASSIVLGRQTDGWISWRDGDGNFYITEG
jgi:hypothetical protein